MVNLASYVYQTVGTRRNEITITEQSGNSLSDYQIGISLDSEWGGWNYVSEDGNDIYFIDGSGDPLYFWIERFDYANRIADIWVKIPSIPASGTVIIYMYYGSGSNPYASYNDPDQVFLLFKDFEDGTTQGLNVIAGTFAAEIFDGSYRLHQTEASGNRRGYWPETISAETFAVHAKTYDPVDEAYIFIYLRDSTQARGWLAGWSSDLDKMAIMGRSDGGSTIGTDQTKSHTFNGSIWYDIVIKYKGSGVIRIEADGDYFEVTRTENFSPDTIGVWCGYEKYWDDIFVRKYVEPEPTISIAPSAPLMKSLDLM